MKKQIIVAIGREHGSGGHYIADLIARELGVKLYDKVSIEKEITSGGYSEELVSEMDESPSTFLPPAASDGFPIRLRSTWRKRPSPCCAARRRRARASW